MRQSIARGLANGASAILLEGKIVGNVNIAALAIVMTVVPCAAGIAPAAQTEQIQFTGTVFFPSGTNPKVPCGTSTYDSYCASGDCGCLSRYVGCASDFQPWHPSQRIDQRIPRSPDSVSGSDCRGLRLPSGAKTIRTLGTDSKT